MRAAALLSLLKDARSDRREELDNACLAERPHAPRRCSDSDFWPVFSDRRKDDAEIIQVRQLILLPRTVESIIVPSDSVIL
jgi:hypothetical protein